ncbi:MAG: ATP-binding protein [Bacteroidota bacterium]
MLLFAGAGNAQQALRPDRLTIEDGLSQGYVSALLQDRQGFLWVGTKNGLNRYDGNTFEVFAAEPTQANVLAEDWVTDLLEIGDYLLIATNGPKLSLLHRPTRKFYTLSLEEHLRQPQVDFAAKLLQDSNGDVWINLQPSHRLLRLRFSPAFPAGRTVSDDPFSEVELITVLDQGQWIAAVDERHLAVRLPQGIRWLNKTMRSLVDAPLPHPWNTLSATAGYNIQPSLVQDGEQLLVRTTAGWRRFTVDFTVGFALYDADAKRLWVQDARELVTYLYSLPKVSDRALLTAELAEAVVAGERRGVRRGLVDRNGVLWLGTNGYGLQKIPDRSLRVKQWLTGQSLYDYPVVAAGDELLLNQLQGRLFYQPGGSGQLANIYAALLPAELGKNFRAVPNGRGGFWLVRRRIEKLTGGKYRQRLEVSLAEQGRLSPRHRLEFESLSEFGPFTLAVAERELIVGLQDRIVIIDLPTGKRRAYTVPLPVTARLQFYNAIRTADGTWWVGTSLGLVSIQAGSSATDEVSVLTPANSGLTHADCASLLLDPETPSALWVATKGGGLHHFSLTSNDWTQLGIAEGLPDRVIYGLLADNQGTLWMSSNRGIINYDPGTGDIRQFTQEDGLQGSEFNTFAYAKSTDGTLYFGGVNGLNGFRPEALIEQREPQPARISSLAVNNRRVLPRDSQRILCEDITFASSITLPFTQNNLEFSFAAPDFSAPNRTRYQYYLAELERPWEHDRNDHRATYLNLPPGRYTFRLRATNGDGVWSEQPTELTVKILAPWYRTWWAYALYGVLVFVAIRWYLREQRRRLQLRQEVVAEQQRARSLEDAEAFRTRLYQNLTHEFRIPLTVIAGVVDQLEVTTVADYPEENINLLRRSTDNLLNLINQQLDLARAQQASHEIELVVADFVAYLGMLVDGFQPLARTRGITLEFEGSGPEVVMAFDEDKVARIVTNLLSNALKFTPAGGEVGVSLWRPSAAELIVSVRDSGRGISPAELPFVFDRFYQSREGANWAEGSGIGLSFARELAWVIGGDITADSRVGKGSEFRFNLRVTPPALPVTNGGKVMPEVPEQAAVTNTDRFKLLIVEDNAEVATFLKGCLAAEYDLIFAARGDEGVKKARRQIPDLIISDLRMPGLSGYQVCETLKSDLLTSHVPFIMLTASAEDGARIEGFARGADAYVAKPFRAAALKLQIRNLLALQSRWRERYRFLDEPLPASADLAIRQEDDFIAKVKRIVLAHLDDETFGVQVLCREVGMSRSQIHLKLKALTGLSTSRFVRAIRLNAAKQLFRTTEMNVSEVADAVGFTTRSYFSRAFTEEFGVSPKTFRAQV